MSRWIEDFENHPFQAVWKQILTLTEEVTADDKTIVTDVEEIARFIKIVTFLNELLNACDPELIPASTWNTFNSQSGACLQQINHYQNNRNIAHITNANGNLDNLLTYIRPYQVVAGKAAKSASTSFTAYSKAVSSNLILFQEEVKLLISEIEEHRETAVNNASESESAKTLIKNLEKSFFDDTDTESLNTRIHNLETSIEQSYDKIKDLKTEVFDGDSETGSIEREIRESLAEAKSNKEEIDSILSSIESKTKDFKSFHTSVFGERNEEGILEGGLKNEIANREKHLDQFKKEQEIRYKALNTEIEDLLPGATSAGMAKAYFELKESFIKPIENYSRLFYGSIGCLIIVAFLAIIQELGFWYIKLIDVSNLNILASNVLYKLPIVLPVLWLTVYASKRRSEALRLQQEYSHKEALAKSYQDFKKQIEALNEPDPELMKKLLNVAIDAISKNASDTLDKKHGDKPPITQGIDEVIETIGKMKKSLS